MLKSTRGAAIATVGASMPDWFYRTVSRPLLFRLPDPLARKIALGVIGTLGRSWVGRSCIDLLGHMRADAALRTARGGVVFPSPAGLGRRVDPEALATRALARFGVGFVEVGPVTVQPVKGDVVQRGETFSLSVAQPEPSAGLNVWRQKLARLADLEVPLLVRLAGTREELQVLVGEIGTLAALFVVAGEEAPVTKDLPVLRAIGWEEQPGALAVGLSGIVLEVENVQVPGRRELLAWLPAELTSRVRAWRETLGADAVLLVAGGVAEPEEALVLLEAGADLLLVDAGLVFSGPGLPKRINEALLARAGRQAAMLPSEPMMRCSWFWATAVGGAMLGGGVLALALSATRVLLPYDEHYLGLSRAALKAAAPQLVHFMAHDRATLAGVMLAVGALYVGLARGGMRRGQHWAHVSVAASALVGFATFFSFLGFGYFDPFHAFVTAVLFQLLLLILSGRQVSVDTSDAQPDLRGDGVWRAGLWGQLLLVLHSAGLLFAGALILVIGMTQVFVSEDLAYLCMTAGQVTALNEKLLAVVAHDRATLGGMLLAAGAGMLLATLWGWARGRAWLWWTFLWTGLPAYGCALGVHLVVGYTDWRHMLPAVAGLGLWAAGLGLARPYLWAQRRGGIAGAGRKKGAVVMTAP